MDVNNGWRARSRRKARIESRLRSPQLELALSFERPKSSLPPPTSKQNTTESLMDDEIVLMREVVRRTKRHRSTIYRWMERDEFPRQLKTKSGRAIGWSRIAFESWMKAPVSIELLSGGRE